MKPTFTQGEWVADGTDVWVRPESGWRRHIADCAPTDRGSIEEFEANAALIAAAPDLLAACIEAHAIATDGTFSREDAVGYLYDFVVSKMGEPIAKAEGGAQ